MNYFVCETALLHPASLTYSFVSYSGIRSAVHQWNPVKPVNSFKDTDTNVLLHGFSVGTSPSRLQWITNTQHWLIKQLSTRQRALLKLMRTGFFKSLLPFHVMRSNSLLMLQSTYKNDNTLLLFTFNHRRIERIMCTFQVQISLKMTQPSWIRVQRQSIVVGS